MYVCSVCGREWNDEAALANRKTCYRSCDAPLVHVEEEAGVHLDYRSAIRLDPDSGFGCLRDAILAVKPGGVIELPPGRHSDPLVLDKPITIRRTADADGPVYLTAELTSAVKVRAPDVRLVGLTMIHPHRNSRGPLVQIESGALRMEDCILDVHGGEGVRVADGAILRVIACRIHDVGLYGIGCTEGSSTFVESTSIRGTPRDAPEIPDDDADDISLLAGRTGIVTGGGSTTIDASDLSLAGLDVAIHMREARGSFRRLRIDDCHRGWKAEAPRSLEIDSSEIRSTMEPILLSGGEIRLASSSIDVQEGSALQASGSARVSLADCEISGGEPAIDLRACDANIAACRSRGARTFVRAVEGSVEIRATSCVEPSETAYRFEGGATAEIRGGVIEEGFRNAVVIGPGSTSRVTGCRLSRIQGVAVLALEKGRAEVDRCEMAGCGVGCYALPGADLTVSDSMISDTTGSAILLQDGARGTFRRITLAGARADQFVCGTSESPSILTESVIREGRAGGVRVLDSGSLTITDTEIHGHRGSGVVLGVGSTVDLSGVRITGNQRTGVLLGAHATLNVDGGECSENGGCGIWAHEPGPCHVAKLMVARNGLAGAFLDAAPQGTFESVRFHENRGPGIFLTSPESPPAAGSWQLECCDFRGNRGECILVIGGAGLTASGCILVATDAECVRAFGQGGLEIASCELSREGSPACQLGPRTRSDIRDTTFKGFSPIIRLGSHARLISRNNGFPEEVSRPVRRGWKARVERS